MSRSDKERRKRTPALAANGYAFHLRKPVEPSELLDMLMSLIPQALILDLPKGAMDALAAQSSVRSAVRDREEDSGEERPAGALPNGHSSSRKQRD